MEHVQIISDRRYENPASLAMFCFSPNSTDPCFNLAVEEYLLKNTSDDFLILGINDRSVIIGKHQVAHRETDTRFVSEHKIPVIRRISGGGTVFHDKGNMNFSFILNSGQGIQIDFRKYTQPVIDFLASIGVDAKFEGKNDLKVGGFKISGNAEHIYRNRVLHHGTLLFNTDIPEMKGSIRNDTGKYETRAVVSNPSSVINLTNVLKNVLKDVFKNVLKYVDNIHEFKAEMMQWFLNNYSGAEPFSLSDEDNKKIETLAGTKYRSWEWNYGYGPKYNFANRFEYKRKECFCSLFVKDGIIRECEIKGNQELEAIGKNLPGCRHMVDALQGIFIKANIFNQVFDIYNLF
jgi:lipoate-protein ligase A